jgi:CRP-like cAMP-binding protein
MMFKNKMADALSHVEVFEGLTQDDLKIISKHCKKMSFEAGEILVEIGLRPSAFYILITGQLRVFLPKQIKGKKEHRVSEINLNILNKGDCFGEYSLIEKRPASASVAGVEPGEVIKITEDGFDRIMADDRVAKTVYYNLIHVLIKRLRKKEQELDMVLVAG